MEWKEQVALMENVSNCKMHLSLSISLSLLQLFAQLFAEVKQISALFATRFFHCKSQYLLQ